MMQRRKDEGLFDMPPCTARDFLLFEYRETTFVQRYNTETHPFVWVATADSILAKIGRLCSLIGGT